MPTIPDDMSLETALLFFSEDPALRIFQSILVVLGVISVYLLLFATRDIILRTQNMVYQLLCILIVALLPTVGFFLYLLIRPPRTVKERKLEKMLLSLTHGEDDEEGEEEKDDEEEK